MKLTSECSKHLVFLLTLSIRLFRSRSKLEATYRLHQVGVRHYDLEGEENFITHGDRVYIVGFSQAEERCGCEITKDRVRLCPEMMWAEEQFGDGETNNVLKEIGVPPGWRMCLNEATWIVEGMSHGTALHTWNL